MTDTSITLLQLLINATGAEFEDQQLAVDIIEKTIVEYTKLERRNCIDDIRVILGQFGEDREDIKKKFRDLCKRLETIN